MSQSLESPSLCLSTQNLSGTISAKSSVLFGAGSLSRKGQCVDLMDLGKLSFVEGSFLWDTDKGFSVCWILPRRVEATAVPHKKGMMRRLKSFSVKSWILHSQVHYKYFVLSFCIVQGLPDPT